jgi:hypothetical protein
MSIALNGGSGETAADAKTESFKKDLLAAKRGDWNARHRVESTFNQILTDLAKKRASSNADINALIEAGKQGIAIAIKKFKIDSGADRFQIFALQFIEKKMDNPNSGGFFAKLFGG